MEDAEKRNLRIYMLLPVHYGLTNTILYPSMEILSYLTRFGHDITWVVSAEVGYQFQECLPYGVKVHTVYYRRYFPGNSLWAKIFNHTAYLIRRMAVILRTLNERKYDIVVVRNDVSISDVLDSLLTICTRRKHRFRLVFYLANPIEQPSVVLKLVHNRLRPLFYLKVKIKEFVDSYLVSKADLILTVSEWLKEHLVKKGYLESRIFPAPEGVDVNVYFKKDENDIRERYDLHNSKVLLYVGMLAKPRSLSLLIEAFSILTAKIKNIKLLMVGDGNDRKNLEELANSLGVKEDVIFTGQVCQAEIPDFVAAADIGVSPIPPTSFYKLSSPIKMLEYMAGGKPVVANEEIFDQKEVIEQSGGGILVPFTSEAFAEAMIELLNNPERAAEMGRRAREWVSKNRSYEILARRVEERYLNLIQIKTCQKATVLE